MSQNFPSSKSNSNHPKSTLQNHQQSVSGGFPYDLQSFKRANLNQNRSNRNSNFVQPTNLHNPDLQTKLNWQSQKHVQVPNLNQHQQRIAQQNLHFQEQNSSKTKARQSFINSQNPFLNTYPQSQPRSQNLQPSENFPIRTQENEDSYYSSLISWSLLGLFLYYLGAILIIFIRVDNGQAISTLPSYEISWRLLFSDFALFLQNFFKTVFGYFIEYAKLFGLFEEEGIPVADPKPRYLMPVDIFIKGVTIYYFNFLWMNWDLRRAYGRGYFSKNYPYIPEADREEIITKLLAKEEKQLVKDPFEKDLQEHGIQKNATDFQKNDFSSPKLIKNFDDEEEENDDDDFSPFHSVFHSIEEFYYRHEDVIYSFIRKRLIPGSNFILVLYFSTLSVLQLTNPISVVLYFLGIMSMYWCIQGFIVALDHSHHPPEDDLND